MHGLVAAVIAEVEEGPTVRPSPLTSVFFLLLLGALVLLLWSFLRHLRRAQSNLGSARLVPDATGAPGEVEGDSR